MALCLIEGNEAIARGAIAAGCRFFAGYPITPASTLFSAMLEIVPASGGICIQGEDEISSIGQCLGASMGGMKVMTATSGPGISLYSEQISFAIGSEIPIVIVDVQRLGPSTGSATRGADGDIQFLRWGNSGGLPVIVLAPVNVADCYLLTIHAFNLAERYRCPVFIASNKEIGMTRESVDIRAIPIPEIVDRKKPPPDKPFLPFHVPSGQMVPDFLPMGGDIIVRQTSSTHGLDGYITTNTKAIADNLDRIEKKLLTAVDRFTFYESRLEDDADTLILTYGVTARAAGVVYDALKKEGKPVSLLVLKTLWPVPEKLIRSAAENVGHVLVVEMNMGQYVREIRRVIVGKPVDFFGQMNGNLITPDQIKQVVNRG